MEINGPHSPRAKNRSLATAPFSLSQYYPLVCARARAKYFVARLCRFPAYYFCAGKVEVREVGRQVRVCHDFHRLDDFAIAAILLRARTRATHDRQAPFREAQDDVFDSLPIFPSEN